MRESGRSGGLGWRRYLYHDDLGFIIYQITWVVPWTRRNDPVSAIKDLCHGPSTPIVRWLSPLARPRMYSG